LLTWLLFRLDARETHAKSISNGVRNVSCTDEDDDFEEEDVNVTPCMRSCRVKDEPTEKKEGHHCAPLLDEYSWQVATISAHSDPADEPGLDEPINYHHAMAAPLDISMMWSASKTGNFVDLTRGAGTNHGAGGAGPSHAMKGEDKEEEQWANCKPHTPRGRPRVI
jgi:hypothetical protein